MSSSPLVPSAAPHGVVAQPEPEPGGLRVADVFRLAVKHAFWVLLFAILVPVGVAFWTARQPRVYEASTTIIFDLVSTNTLGKNVETFDPYSNYLNQQELVETEFRVLTSMRTAKQVVVDAGLDSDRAFLASAFPGVPADRVTSDALAGYVRARLRVEPVKGTHLALVAFEDNDPARAQRLAMTVVSTYIRMSNEDAGGVTGAALTYLTDQLARLKVDLETSEMALHSFKRDRNLLSVSFNDQSNMLREEITAVNQAVTASSIRRAQLLSRASALSKVTAANPDDVPASEFLSNDTLRELRTKYRLSRDELNVQRGLGKLENHPDVVVVRARLEDSVGAFIAEVRNMQAAATRDAAVAASEVGALSGLLEQAKQRAFDLNMQEISYNGLYRQASTNEKLYQNVLERMKEVDLSRMMSPKNIKTLDPAVLPSSPIRPRASFNVGVGAGVGLLLGLIVAFFREIADRTVKTPHDVEAKLNLTNLGLLPESESGTARGSRQRRRRGAAVVAAGPELLVHELPNSMMAEAARSIRSNVLFMSPDKPPRVILVTSALPGEGKTTTAVALATTFAQAGSRVLLVDLDLRRPRVHRIFGVGSERGITTVLLGEPLETALHTTRVPNLSVLPAGPIPPNPAELLMSEKMHELLGQLGEKYDRVIIDSPPANPVTDAVVLSTRVDGVLLVVRAFHATLDQVRHAARSIESVKGTILGVVLNAVDFGKMEYKYYYYKRYYNYSSATPANAAES